MHYDRLKTRVLAAVRSSPSGVALVILEENNTWAAQYGKNRGSFNTEAQALHFVHQHAPQNVPTVIINL